MANNDHLASSEGKLSLDQTSEPIALEAYEAIAERFAELIDTKPHNAYYERPATLSLLPDVRGKRVLDAGCGPGAYVQWLADRGAEVLAIDVSPKMVELARRRARGRAEIIHADLNAGLGFLRDGTFDVVVSALALDYVLDWDRAFSEFHRVLRMPGYLIFSMQHPFAAYLEYHSEEYFELERVSYESRAFGEPVVIPSYRRPLGEALTPLIEAGFVLERILEPQPTEQFKHADPKNYAKLSSQPFFLCVRAAKVN